MEKEGKYYIINDGRYRIAALKILSLQRYRMTEIPMIVRHLK